jgi:ANTAR domain
VAGVASPPAGRKAEGVSAERRRLDMDESFILLRSTARTGNRRLSDLARAVDGSEPLTRARNRSHAAG